MPSSDKNRISVPNRIRPASLGTWFRNDAHSGISFVMRRPAITGRTKPIPFRTSDLTLDHLCWLRPMAAGAISWRRAFSLDGSAGISAGWRFKTSPTFLIAERTSRRVVPGKSMASTAFITSARVICREKLIIALRGLGKPRRDYSAISVKSISKNQRD